VKSPVAIALAVALAAFVAAAPPAEAASRKPAAMVLNSLPVASEVASGYSRGLFRLWLDADRDGCDTREEVLVAEATSGSVVGCAVSNGRWVSTYDGVSTANPSTFDIDHMVPLKEAWDSGAWRWSAATRNNYANDLGYAAALIAVSASSNRSKSDRDPTDWLPALARCTYAKYWIGVKYRWRLSVDPAEKSALTRVLSNCRPLMTVPPLAARTVDAGAEAPTAGSPSQGSSSGGTDPRFGTCAEAVAAGYGPYARGVNDEYDWYIDRDSDGVVCES